MHASVEFPGGNCDINGARREEKRRVVEKLGTVSRGCKTGVVVLSEHAFARFRKNGRVVVVVVWRINGAAPRVEYNIHSLSEQEGAGV